MKVTRVSCFCGFLYALQNRMHSLEEEEEQEDGGGGGEDRQTDRQIDRKIDR